MRNFHELFFKRTFSVKFAQLLDWSFKFKIAFFFLNFRVFFEFLVVFRKSNFSYLSKSLSASCKGVKLGGHQLFAHDSGGDLGLSEDLQKVSEVS